MRGCNLHIAKHVTRTAIGDCRISYKTAHIFGSSCIDSQVLDTHAIDRTTLAETVDTSYVVAGGRYIEVGHPVPVGSR